MDMQNSRDRTVRSFRDGAWKEITDPIVEEKALTIVLNGQEFATVVCSPWALEALTAGFLASEGVLQSREALQDLYIDHQRGFAYAEVDGFEDGVAGKGFLKRYVTACCGRGRASFYYANDALLCEKNIQTLQIPPQLVLSLAARLETQSELFQRTGGVHCAALAGAGGFWTYMEDVGRHNTLDKLLGVCFLQDIPLEDKIVVFSGRISSEILLKVSKMRCAVIVARSAPPQTCPSLWRRSWGSPWWALPGAVDSMFTPARNGSEMYDAERICLPGQRRYHLAQAGERLCPGGQRITLPWGDPGRGSHRMARDAERIVGQTRRLAASFFGLSDPNSVIFTYSATDALSTVIHGIIPDGSRVLLGPYDHNAVYRPLLARRDLELLYAGSDGAFGWDLEGLRRQCAGGVDFAVFSHASNVTGCVAPLREIAEIVHNVGGTVILDASQSTGTVPICMDEDGIYVLCTAGHKGLLGSMGTGLLLLGQDNLRITPLREGGTGIRSEEPGMPEEYPWRLEAGTCNLPGIAALGRGASVSGDAGAGNGPQP